MQLRINQVIKETFQGEGDSVGRLSTLIRFSGCNLKCPFCDTKQTWNENKSDLILESDTIPFFA